MDNYPETLEDALLSAAVDHAKRAFRDRDSTDFHCQLGSSASAGTAVELFLKYLLIRKQPLYLQELKPKDIKTAWRTRQILAGKEQRYRSALADINSVSATEAIEMVGSIYEALELSDLPLKAALQVRNAALHLAVLSDGELFEEAIYAVIMLFKSAHDLDLIDWLPFGRRALEVDTFVRLFRERRINHVKRKIADAQTAAKEVPGLTVDERRDVREDLSFFIDCARRSIEGDSEDRIFGVGVGYRMHKCRACRESGTAIYELTGEVDEVEVEGQVRETQIEIADVFAFACENCGLTLSLTELHTLLNSGDDWVRPLSESIVTPDRPIDGY